MAFGCVKCHVFFDIWGHNRKLMFQQRVAHCVVCLQQCFQHTAEVLCNALNMKVNLKLSPNSQGRYHRKERGHWASEMMRVGTRKQSRMVASSLP